VKFKLPGGEVSGVYRNGETWHLRSNADTGIVEVNEGKEPEIAETLIPLADDPDHPIEHVKTKTKE
jgi:hypothetical protein